MFEQYYYFKPPKMLIKISLNLDVRNQGFELD